MSIQDVSKLLKDVPPQQCEIITTLAQKVIQNMNGQDLLVSEQLLLPKVLEIAIRDINNTDEIGAVKDSVILAERNARAGAEK
ncbi:hypothetical protein [Sporomusa sp. KB1]|jgi:hypothetical protein|uniref:hypothetical protein n=1 Tax=Sporomusa sp. KB1 TaxID=943346 RepID=UPI0011AAFF29|nr:hypothetical protein [Sporomusa sp. KB1]TWH46439.1 hypothetical protein Salpa_2428 [Sporomusa sp. KB1]